MLLLIYHLNKFFEALFFPYSGEEFALLVIHMFLNIFWLPKGLCLLGSCLDFKAPWVAVESSLSIKLSEWQKEKTHSADYSETCSIHYWFLKCGLQSRRSASPEILL